MGDGKAEFLRDKYVKIMADYGADPIWDKDGFCCPLDWLPVTADLANALMDWEVEFDIQTPWNPGSNFDYADHQRRGRELARRVKAQLPDWTVTFFDESGPRHIEIDEPTVRASSWPARARDNVTRWLRSRRPGV